MGGDTADASPLDRLALALGLHWDWQPGRQDLRPLGGSAHTEGLWGSLFRNLRINRDKDYTLLLPASTQFLSHTHTHAASIVPFTHLHCFSCTTVGAQVLSKRCQVTFLLCPLSELFIFFPNIHTCICPLLSLLSYSSLLHSKDPFPLLYLFFNSKPTVTNYCVCVCVSAFPLMFHPV